jgi:hypothetical protein
MIPGICVETGKFGYRVVVGSEWSSKIESYLISNQIVDLELNDGKGWVGRDLSFLERLPFLKSFTIIDLQIGSVAPIHYLHNLCALKVFTYCKTPIDCSAFPNLEELKLEWRRGSDSIFNCKTLKILFLNKYSNDNLCALKPLKALVSLAVLNAPIGGLLGLVSLKQLRSLRLANLKRLKSLSGIENLVNLEELEVHTCPAIDSIEELHALLHLKILNLSNNGSIQSLQPLRNLKELETLLFYESTNIRDGDLSSILKKKKLRKLSFMNRRHYSHKREEISEMLGI